MAQNTIRTGIDQYVVFGEETTFATEPAALNKSFNFLQSFGSNLSRSLIKIKGISGNLPSANTELTSRDTQRIVRGKFEGSVNVSFNPVTFDFMKYVLGTVSGAGSVASPFNYPQATAATDSDKRNYLKIPSLSISTNYYFDGSGDAVDKVWKMLGWKVGSCTVSGSVGEPCTVALDGAFADLKGSTTLDDPIALPTEDPYHFIDASFEYPTGSPINNITESFELSVTNELELLWGMGSDIAKESKEKGRDFSLKLNMTREGTAFMDDFMGDATTLGIPTEIASITVKLQKDADRIINIICLQCKIGENPLQEDYPNVSKENIVITPKLVYITEVDV